MLKLDYACLTDIGKKRKNNQDSVGFDINKKIFVVADGIGGHKGGEVASSISVEAITSFEFGSKDESVDISNLKNSIYDANTRVYKTSIKDKNLKGMGTTITAIKFNEEIKKAFIAQVGDSRCYFLRKNSIWQLTQDHSFVEEKIRAGIITRDQVKDDDMKNIITRSVGAMPTVDVDTFSIASNVGDVFLLCSDGLYGLVSNEKTLEIVDQDVFSENNLKKAAQNLINEANSCGGNDNISVILIKVCDT